MVGYLAVGEVWYYGWLQLVKFGIMASGMVISVIMVT